MRSTLFSAAFTLIELIITIVVIILLLVMAIPSFNALIQNNTSISLSSELAASLNFARSEAIKRGVSVSICAQNPATSTCGTNWNNGWIVFTNPNEDGVFSNDASEILLRSQMVGKNIKISSLPAITIATYTASGFALPASTNVQFTITSTGCTGMNARTLLINNMGRLIITKVSC